MKLLVITTTIEPTSGWGRYSSGVINEYPKQGIDATVITQKDLADNKTLIGFIKNCLFLRKQAKQFDIVHAFDVWPYAVFGWAAVIGTRKKLFINAVGTYSFTTITNSLKGFLIRKAYERAQRVFAISNFIANKIRERIQLKTIETVYLGPSDLPDVSQNEIDNMKTHCKLTSLNSPIILTVGEIKDRKGQLDVVRSINMLKKTYPDIVYLMVGKTKDSGNYVTQINEVAKELGISDNIRIISTIADDKALVAVYHLCDVFILASKEANNHFEGFGLVMLEAASCGKPVVGTRSGGIPEAMKDNYNGFLAHASDPKDIARALDRAYKDRERLGRNSKEFFRLFSWKKTVAAYKDHYVA